MWDINYRKQIWGQLQQKWDVIIIGGGITGAGIFNFAARKGLKVLLLEAKDFAFGTSSRSSKLVHGGLRYLKNGQFDVVRESVRERERLIREAPGLVNKLSFLYPGYKSLSKSQLQMLVGVTIYDLMVPKWDHSLFGRQRVIKDEPILLQDGLMGANQYFDSTVDDSRLVLRVIKEGVAHDGVALNYTKVTGLLKDPHGAVVGVQIEDQALKTNDTSLEIQARVVINASGPWSDEVRKNVNGNPRLRKLRGSHMIFPHQRLPLSQAVTMIHPRDHRALFVVPWEGTTFIGTTDLDQTELTDETAISQLEVDYLLEATNHLFPGCSLKPDDIISTFSGLRPVIDSGADTPSQESRAHQIWEEDGLVTISGGKLTIFRVMAADCLNFISQQLPGNPVFDHRDQVFDPAPPKPKELPLPKHLWRGLAGRHGAETMQLVNQADLESLTPIAPTSNLWAELKWAAEHDAVVHLDDLLLRRIRLGLYLPQGGLGEIEKIRTLVQFPLNWDDERWKDEVDRYKSIWSKYYYLP
ncbi:MAG: glycerol-3-phosphate dehydrogenase/oxidase [Anaerolineaceae bacterium]|nr:glycerol-3-phosphate dehydrogenase/oxidase [Anaerolineaceae bacterium]